MVTANRNDGTKGIANFTFYGKSTDTKPTGEYEGIKIENGSAFVEIDTQELHFYDGAAKAWL